MRETKAGLQRVQGKKMWANAKCQMPNDLNKKDHMAVTVLPMLLPGSVHCVHGRTASSAPAWRYRCGRTRYLHEGDCLN